MPQPGDYDSFDISLVGPDGAGKRGSAQGQSRLANLPRWLSDTQNREVIPESCHPKMVVVDDRLCFLYMHIVSDTSGGMAWEWTSLRKSDGFLLAYAVTDRQTFERIDESRQRVLRTKGATPPTILVGSKCDLSSQREVSTTEGFELGTRIQCCKVRGY
ncbi:hypothetical protein B0H19DRAFT_1055350 [Mycena capillaripes]|nr:hypothetical protein B0H19DRAFT_1055350 [Mycena capillaripes]